MTTRAPHPTPETPATLAHWTVYAVLPPKRRGEPMRRHVIGLHVLAANASGAVQTVLGQPGCHIYRAAACTAHREGI